MRPRWLFKMILWDIKETKFEAQNEQETFQPLSQHKDSQLENWKNL